MRAYLVASVAAGGVAVLSIFAACGGSTSGGGSTPCSDGGVCPAGMVCSGGFCVNPNLGGGGVGTGGVGGIGGTTPLGGSGGLGASGGFGGTGVDPTSPGKQPPPAPSGPPAIGASSTVIAINKILLGETDENFTPNATAWRNIGYNIDGIISTKAGTNHCQPRPGASKSAVQTDGVDGIDNSYGANIVPIVASLTPNPSQTVSEAIREGSWTTIFRLDGLQDPTSNPNQTNILAGYYAGAEFDASVDCSTTPSHPNCSPPLFDGSDFWPVKPELLNNADVNNPKIVFPASYVAGGTWVSGSVGTVVLGLPILLGAQGNVPLNHAVITMNVSGMGDFASATFGVIAGVIPTDALIAEMKKVAGSFDPALCDGPTFDSIAQQLSAASDIMVDGSNGDPTKTCDGISIGLGFEGYAIHLGGAAPAEPPLPDPCGG